MANIFTRLISSVFKDQIAEQVREQLSVVETDQNFYEGSSTQSPDRLTPDRNDILRLSLEAWHDNPLARRIVGLTTQYVVGGGIGFTCKHDRTLKFMREFWKHPLNRMQVQTYEWCDELTRTGNLFILLTTDIAGMSYVRAIPTSMIDEIISKPNDVYQPTSFKLKTEIEPVTYKAYQKGDDSETHRSGTVLQFTINQPVGGQWGESDLAPVLKWLSRYSNWLEDRARLNRYRNAFIWVLTGKFASDANRLARQKELNSSPPTPGSILVVNEGEEWEAKSANLESADAEKDGLAIKKMLAAGTGIPMHFLAEPEGSTRTTAEAAGGPTYRHFEQRQLLFSFVIEQIFLAVIERRRQFDKKIQHDPKINIAPADISSRDNVSLAMAASNIINALNEMRDRQIIDDAEFCRLTYKFIGETTDIEEMLARGKKAGPPITRPKESNGYNPNINKSVKKVVDQDTGEEKSSVQKL
jgi:hypothetical protein